MINQNNIYSDKLEKLAMGIEYDGSTYYGWQKQSNLPSVQESLERAISKVAAESVNVYCAGRTDAGVHATGQVVHFQTSSRRDLCAWMLGINANLPDSISVRWVVSISANFHARFSATARCYRYIIYNHRHRPAILNKGLTHCYHPLDAKRMEQAGKYLLGEHDFTSFRSSKCQSNTPWRYLYHLQVIRLGRYIVVDIKANAFLHHMVRNIVGSLIEVGCGKKKENWIADLLVQRNHNIAIHTANPKGLYLVKVDYPSNFLLPDHEVGPLFINI